MFCNASPFAFIFLGLSHRKPPHLPGYLFTPQALFTILCVLIIQGKDGAEDLVEVSRVLSVKGGPVFSLAKVPSAVLDAAANGNKKIVYCGTANKDILFYTAGSTELDDKVRLASCILP